MSLQSLAQTISLMGDHRGSETSKPEELTVIIRTHVSECFGHFWRGRGVQMIEQPLKRRKILHCKAIGYSTTFATHVV